MASLPMTLNDLECQFCCLNEMLYAMVLQATCVLSTYVSDMFTYIYTVSYTHLTLPTILRV